MSPDDIDSGIPLQLDPSSSKFTVSLSEASITIARPSDVTLCSVIYAIVFTDLAHDDFNERDKHNNYATTKVCLRCHADGELI